MIIYHLPPIKGTRNSYWHCMHGIFDDWCICVVSDSIDVGKDSLHRVGLSFAKRIYEILWVCIHLAGVFVSFQFFEMHPQKLTMTMENQPFEDVSPTKRLVIFQVSMLPRYTTSFVEGAMHKLFAPPMNAAGIRNSGRLGKCTMEV